MFLDAIETQQAPSYISANQLAHRKLAYNIHGKIELFLVGSIAPENEGAIAFNDDFMPYRSAHAQQEQAWNCAILVYQIITEIATDQPLNEAIKSKLSSNIKNPDQVAGMMLQAFNHITQGQILPMNTMAEAYLQYRLSTCDQNKFNQFLSSMVGNQEVPSYEIMTQIVRTQVMADLKDRTALVSFSVQNENTDDLGFNFNLAFTPANTHQRSIKRRPYLGTNDAQADLMTDTDDAQRNARREQKLWNTTLYN